MAERFRIVAFGDSMTECAALPASKRGCARHIVPDGVHFTAAGSRVAGEVVWAALLPCLRQRFGESAGG